MCSLFGFIANKNARPDLNTLRSIIRANVARGPHAYGFSWIDPHGRLHMFKAAGKLSDNLSALNLLRDARMVIGHLRYATHGSPDDNSNNHPHSSDGGWIVHNGVIRNHADLIKAHNLPTLTECDSETLALMLEYPSRANASRSLLTRAAAAAGETDGSLAMLGLWKPAAGGKSSDIGTLLAIRRGNPLHGSETVDGLYLATLPAGLPGKSGPLKDNTAHQIALSQSFSRTVSTKAVTDSDPSTLFTTAGEYAGG